MLAVICLPLIGLSTSYFAFRGLGIYDSVKRISELGFSTAELGAAHSFEENIWATLEKIKSDFPKMIFTVHGLFPPLEEQLWFNASLGLSDQNKKIIQDMFKVAELMNAVCVTVHAGFLSEMHFGENIRGMNYGKSGKEIPREQAVKGISEIVSLALELAGEQGISFGIENNTRGTLTPAIYTRQEFSEIFEKFPKLGFLLDMGHALAEQRLEKMLEFKDRIVQMHVHYSKPKSEAMKLDEHATLPSKDSIAFMKNIKQIKKIPLIFEHGTDVTTEQILEEKKLLENFLTGV